MAKVTAVVVLLLVVTSLVLYYVFAEKIRGDRLLYEYRTGKESVVLKMVEWTHGEAAVCALGHAWLASNYGHDWVGLPESEIRELFGRPAVQTPEDWDFSTPHHRSSTFDRVLHYGEDGWPHGEPADGSSNLYFYILKGRVIDVGTLMP